MMLSFFSVNTQTKDDCGEERKTPCVVGHKCALLSGDMTQSRGPLTGGTSQI